MGQVIRDCGQLSTKRDTRNRSLKRIFQHFRLLNRLRAPGTAVALYVPRARFSTRLNFNEGAQGMNRRYVLSTLAVIGLMANARAQADEASRFYFGAGVGEVTSEADGFEGNGVGFKAFAGIAFSKYFATEIEYLDAGILTDTVDDLDLEVTSDGVVVATLGKLPLAEALCLYAKVGYAFYDQTVSAKRGSLSITEKSTAEDPLYGAGAELNLGRTFQLRASMKSSMSPMSISM
jgi:hypothetical protein